MEKEGRKDEEEGRREICTNQMSMCTKNSIPVFKVVEGNSNLLADDSAILCYSIANCTS